MRGGGGRGTAGVSSGKKEVRQGIRRKDRQVAHGEEEAWVRRRKARGGGRQKGE